MPPSRERAACGLNGKWLSVVGIGEDGVAGLGEAARGLVEGAEVVFGGRRHLALAAGLIRGEARDVAGAVRRGRGAGAARAGGVRAGVGESVPARRGRDAGAGGGAGEMAVVPGASAFGLAAARMGWALQEVETVALHGRPAALIRPLLQPGVRVLALTGDGDGAGGGGAGAGGGRVRARRG